MEQIPWIKWKDSNILKYKPPYIQHPAGKKKNCKFTQSPWQPWPIVRCFLYVPSVLCWVHSSAEAAAQRALNWPGHGAVGSAQAKQSAAQTVYWTSFKYQSEKRRQHNDVIRKMLASDDSCVKLEAGKWLPASFLRLLGQWPSEQQDVRFWKSDIEETRSPWSLQCVVRPLPISDL